MYGLIFPTRVSGEPRDEAAKRGPSEMFLLLLRLLLLHVRLFSSLKLLCLHTRGLGRHGVCDSDSIQICATDKLLFGEQENSPPKQTREHENLTTNRPTHARIPMKYSTRSHHHGLVPTPPSSALRPPPSALRPPPSVLRLPPSVLCLPPSVLRPPSSALRPPPSVLRLPPSALRPPSSVFRPPSSVLYRRCPLTPHPSLPTPHSPPLTPHQSTCDIPSKVLYDTHSRYEASTRAHVLPLQSPVLERPVATSGQI